MSIVRDNAEKDPTYCPYCLRCRDLVRMRLVEPFYWRCSCGAEHDERARHVYGGETCAVAHYKKQPDGTRQIQPQCKYCTVCNRPIRPDVFETDPCPGPPPRR